MSIKKGKTWTFLIDPVPASRPKVSRWGTYYSKTYEQFRKQAKKIVSKQLKDHKKYDTWLEVDIWLFKRRPKKTDYLYPKRGDIDNYTKATFDSLNKLMWIDDDLIVDSHSHKRWANPGEPGHIMVTVIEKQE